MKKFLTILLSLTLVLSVFALVGCQPEEKEHVHDLETTWSYNATEHWHACAGCDEKVDRAEHTLDENSNCTVCEFTKPAEHEHDFGSDWKKDADKHWHECTVENCFEKSDEANHTFVGNKCSVCEYERKEQSVVPGDEETELSFTMDEILKKIDLVKGFTANLDADFTLGSLLLNQEQDLTLDITGAVKAQKKDDAYSVDVSASEAAFGDVEAFLRGDDLYVDSAMLQNVMPTADEPAAKTYVKISISEIADMMGSITTEGPNPMSILSFAQMYMDELVKLGEYSQELVFTKEGDAYKAQFDYIAFVQEQFERYNNVLKILTPDSTIKDIYDAIEGDEILKFYFGDIKGKDFYNVIKKIITSKELADMMQSPDFDAMVSTLFQETADEFIEALNGFIEETNKDLPDGQKIEFTLPEMGDKLMRDYVKELISIFNDKTIYDVIYHGDDSVSKEEMTQNINDVKTEITEIYERFDGNSIKFNMVIDKNGAVKEIGADISLKYGLISLYGFDVDEKEFDKVAIVGTLKVDFNFGAPTFTDVETLNAEDFQFPGMEDDPRQEMVAQLRTNLIEYIKSNPDFADCKTFYVSVSLAFDDEQGQPTILTTAPEDADKYTVDGNFEITDSGVIVYLLIVLD